MNLLRTVGEKKERFLLYNSLAILVKAVEGEKTTVDLRNEASIFGTIVEADGYMNIIMKDCVFTDARGDRYAYEMFFVQARNIRFVHIPPHSTMNLLRTVGEKKERFLLYNSLAILVKAVEGEKTTVDLRNEASIFGTIVEADGYMNIIMKDCVFTDARGDRYAYEMFFVQARNIRFVHIPPHLRIIPSMKEQLSKLNYKPPKRMIKPTTKSKQAQKIQQEGLMAIEKILSKQNSPGSSKNSD